MDDVSRRVFFIGGEARFPSVRIRCVQIADALGCEVAIGARSAPPAATGDARVFVLVKYRGDLAELQRRGTVVWDVIDDHPPTSGVDCYLYSTTAARDHLRPALPDVLHHVIPHHHCNVARQAPAPTSADAVCFVGGIHWKPELPDLAFEAIDTTAIDVDALRAVYARAHILLNLRAETPAAAAHARLASGIKLINAIGFGVPSVSAREPAFDEIGPDCTLYATHATAAGEVRRLQRDPALHAELRRAALARAEAFHLDTIASRYRALLTELLARA